MFRDKNKENMLQDEIKSLNLRIRHYAEKVKELENSLKNDVRTIDYILEEKSRTEKLIGHLLLDFEKRVGSIEIISDIKLFKSESVGGFIGYRTEVKLK